MTKNKLTALIEKSQAHYEDELRDYIGASSIGSDCLRQIWYQYKGVKGESVPAKTRRTWDIGKRLEGLVVDWLVNAGVKIETTNETFTSKAVPILQGHVDAFVVKNRKKYVLEIKTAKDASFKVFVKHGLRFWYPRYFAQVQTYMGLIGITGAYILVLNKDSSELADECVLFDSEFYSKLEQKADMISRATIEPPKVNSSPAWFACKMCKFNKVCHK